MSREMTEEEREINQVQIDEFFDKFVQIVADGRGMKEKEIRRLADGQVYTGKQAFENGLIDELGYYDDALMDMTKELELDDPVVFEKQPAYSVWSQFLGPFGQSESSAPKEETPKAFEAEVFNYIEKNQSKGNLPEFYYLYGGI